jgi:FkbM family methyltransferase
VPDVASFLSSYESIFVQEAYGFRVDDPRPAILDCGANIGLSVLYFKRLYPQSRITAFEADPAIHRVLVRNLADNGVQGVEVINAAVWSSETTLPFSVEGADAGRLDVGGDRNLTTVRTVRLRDYLEGRKVDLLKLDVEGAEAEVVLDCAEALTGVRAAFVEHHSFPGRKQELGRLIQVMEAAGFRVHVSPALASPSPLRRLRVDETLRMDMRLNLSFWRDPPGGAGGRLTGPGAGG